MDIRQGTDLEESHKFWLEKRIAFNIIVGFSGIVPTIDYYRQLNIFDLAGIMLWGFIANGLYIIWVCFRKLYNYQNR